MSAELSLCGLDMSQFADGDIPQEYRKYELTSLDDLTGTWEDLKKISDPTDTILSTAGVGLIKRKATAIATLKTQIQVKSVDAKGNPVFHLKTFYPLGITKETSFPTDGSLVDQKDADTCDWKCLGVFCNGRLIQKRTGKNGTMYDARIVLKSHPSGASDAKPIMLFLWTLIDNKGVKHQAKCWMKKVA